MATIIVKKKSGKIFTGTEIGEKHWIKEDSEYNNDLYAPEDFWGNRFITDPVDKMGYVIAEFNTAAKKAVRGRKKKRGAKLYRRIENLERRMVNYIPYCTGVYRHHQWYRRKITPKMRPYYPEHRYGHVSKGEESIVTAFLKKEQISDFDFVIDSRYVIVREIREGIWEDMKKTGLVNIDEIESEFSAADM